MTTDPVLEKYAYLFDFHWSRDAKVAERQKKLVRRALTNCTYDFEKWAPRLQIFLKVRVVFVPMTGNVQGMWQQGLMTVEINEKYGTKLSYPIRYGAEIFLHELGHVTDTLVLDGSDRDAITRVWCPPIPGQSTHGWVGGAYENWISEAFASAWAHIYSVKPSVVTNDVTTPVKRFFRFREFGTYGHHRLTSTVRRFIKERLE